jgi:hypothetical protein
MTLPTQETFQRYILKRTCPLEEISNDEVLQLVHSQLDLEVQLGQTWLDLLKQVSYGSVLTAHASVAPTVQQNFFCVTSSDVTAQVAVSPTAQPQIRHSVSTTPLPLHTFNLSNAFTEPDPNDPVNVVRCEVDIFHNMTDKPLVTTKLSALLDSGTAHTVVLDASLIPLQLARQPSGGVTSLGVPLGVYCSSTNYNLRLRVAPRYHHCFKSWKTKLRVLSGANAPYQLIIGNDLLKTVDAYGELSISTCLPFRL